MLAVVVLLHFGLESGATTQAPDPKMFTCGLEVKLELERPNRVEDTAHGDERQWVVSFIHKDRDNYKAEAFMTKLMGCLLRRNTAINPNVFCRFSFLARAPFDTMDPERLKHLLSAAFDIAKQRTLTDLFDVEGAVTSWLGRNTERLDVNGNVEVDPATQAPAVGWSPTDDKPAPLDCLGFAMLFAFHRYRQQHLEYGNRRCRGRVVLEGRSGGGACLLLLLDVLVLCEGRRGCGVLDR